MDGFEFRMVDTVAHLCRIGNVWSLCGAPTGRPAPDRAVPCATCVEWAAAEISEQTSIGT